MAKAIYTQSIIAMIWDFDRTLIPGYSQQPIFDEYEIDSDAFWAEVNSLASMYEARGLKVGADTAYLLHLLTYVREGKLPGLTNSKLKELGARITVCPGMPDFLAEIQNATEENPRFSAHGITLEHYVISTGIKHLIEGSPVAPFLTGIWANEFVDQPPPAGFTPGDHEFDDEEGEIAQIGYMVDNTSKTRAIFEINKGPGVDVNARMAEEDRRVPIRNMIYVADGPSDVPVYSVLAKSGGRRLGVFQKESPSNFAGVKQLEDDARVNSIAEADFQPGSQASMWLHATVKEVAELICVERERYLSALKGPAGHVV